MAQTKTGRGSANDSARSRSSSSRSTRSASRSDGSRATSGSRSRSSSTPRRSSSRESSGADRSPEREGGPVQAVSTAASKAKTPLIAGGAALAGLAGGIAISRNGGRKKVLGVPIPQVSSGRGTKKALDGAAKAFGGAATELGKVGVQVGQLTSEVRRVRERVS
jgi:hypothetical protein